MLPLCSRIMPSLAILNYIAVPLCEAHPRHPAAPVLGGVYERMEKVSDAPHMSPGHTRVVRAFFEGAIPVHILPTGL